MRTTPLPTPTKPKLKEGQVEFRLIRNMVESAEILNDNGKIEERDKVLESLIEFIGKMIKK